MLTASLQLNEKCHCSWLFKKSLLDQSSSLAISNFCCHLSWWHVTAPQNIQILSPEKTVVKTFFFSFMTYGKKFFIHIETIFLSLKPFQSYDIGYNIKPSSKIQT